MVVEEEQVSVLAQLQGAVRVGASQGVGRVDGGCGQGLRHAHAHVDAGQVHDDGLRKARAERSWKGHGRGKRSPLACTGAPTHHGTAVGVGVEVAAEGDDDPSV